MRPVSSCPFLPTIPGLIERLGGGTRRDRRLDEHRRAPRRSVAALDNQRVCIAAVASGENIRSVFNKLLIWGLSMTIVGGVLCYVFF